MNGIKIYTQNEFFLLNEHLAKFPEEAFTLTKLLIAKRIEQILTTKERLQNSEFIEDKKDFRVIRAVTHFSFAEWKHVDPSYFNQDTKFWSSLRTSQKRNPIPKINSTNYQELLATSQSEYDPKTNPENFAKLIIEIVKMLKNDPRLYLKAATQNKNLFIRNLLTGNLNGINALFMLEKQALKQLFSIEPSYILSCEVSNPNYLHHEAIIQPLIAGITSYCEAYKITSLSYDAYAQNLQRKLKS